MIEAITGAAVVWAALPEDASTAGRVHRAFQREAWRDRGLRERAVLCGGFLLWAPAMLGMAAYFVVKLGRRVRRDTGKGHARQLGEQLRLALTRAIPPYWYYLFEFYENEKRVRALEYLYRAETKNGIYEFLRKHLSSAETTRALVGFARAVDACRSWRVFLDRFPDAIESEPTSQEMTSDEWYKKLCRTERRFAAEEFRQPVFELDVNIQRTVQEPGSRAGTPILLNGF